MRIILSALALALFCAPVRAETKHEEFGSLSVDEVQKLIDAKAADIFDNNSRDVWQKGHVPTAKWVKFDDVKAEDLPADKTRKLVFYCANEH